MLTVSKETLKSITIEDIVQWCAENKQTKWLKAKAQETIEQPIYPKVKVANAQGKLVDKIDKKAEPIGTEIVKIPFVNIKRDWVKEFFPELAPTKKPKKLSMWDMIAALPDDE